MNRKTARRASRSVLLFALAALALVLAAGHGLAQSALTSLYHVHENTYGCADPGAVRLLTNLAEARRMSPARMKSLITEGRCVSITARSPWRLVSREGDIALMDYAGDVGPPGSYYLKIDQLFDADGIHPGDAPINPPVAQSPAPADAGPPPETALAPTPQQTAPPPPAPLTGTPVEAAPPQGGGLNPTELVLLVIALGLAGGAGFLLGRLTRK